MKALTKFLFITTTFTTPLFCTDIFIRDAANFYNKETGIILLEGLIPAVLMAHTPLDAKINDFYQDHIRCYETDEAAKAMKFNGYNKALVATYVSGITLGYFFKHSKSGMALYDFGVNSIRATIVGMPTLILGQNIIGASRPEDQRSHWKPFDNDHSISGHAYMGAVPWLTLAMMSKNMILKSVFYAASTGICLSRFNDGAHYPSQIMLAWVLAYASCNSVHNANSSLKVSPNGFSVGVNF